MGARERVLPVVVVCAVLAGLLVWACAPAFAAAPEVPDVSVQLPAPATAVTVHGVLDPGVEGAPGTYELGTYEFLYKQGKAGCEGEGKAPASPGISLGGGKEAVSEVLQGLSPGTEYTVCLLARSGVKGETSVSVPVVFTTAIPPQVPVTSEPASAITASSATLEGVLNPAGKGEAGTYAFLYRRSASECEGEENSGGSMLGAAKETVSAEISGLAPNTQYTFCLVVSNGAGEIAFGAPVTFTTLSSKPSVAGETFSNVGSRGATVSAQVDTGGLESTFTVQYGTTSAYGSETAGVTVPAGATSAGTQLTGLQPDTEYHFRVTVTNKNGTEQGADTTFSTLPPVMNGLPDGRVYEMVTPVENEDAEVYVPNTGLSFVLGFGQGVHTDGEFQSSADGDSVQYFGDPTKGGTGSGGLGEGDSYLATRSPDGGWTQVNTSTVRPPALFSVVPPNRGNFFHSAVAGSSADGSRVFFEANDDLILGEGTLEKELAEDVKSEVEHNEYNNNLYESVEGHLSLTDVLPDGKVAGDSVFGAPPFSNPAEKPSDVSDVVSSRGSRVFWTDLNTGSLYVRENSGQPESPLGPQGECTVPADACTVQVDASQAHGPGGGGRFWTASEDGSKVFFTDSDAAGLTSSTVSGSGTNLYEYEMNQSVGQPGVLRDLTPVTEANVEGVIGTSENGEYIYFVARSVLSNSENSEHQRAVKEGYNLYVLRSGAPPVFIATLSERDGTKVAPFHEIGNDGFGDWQPGLGHRTAEVSPSGGSVVFMSEENLTGYHNIVDGPLGETKLGEVFVYEAGSAQLFCVSCNQSGEPPRVNVESDFGTGGFVPIAWGNGGLHWMSDNGGRVFFDIDQPLVAQDTNEAQDVYEWELDGVGSCRQAEGCVYLLSGGTSSSASWLEGESSSGNDVFIDTRAQLTPGDHSETYNLFDARVDGVQPVSEPVCSGTGCQGAPSPPPTFATPPSVTFEGVGNFPSVPVVSSTPKTTKKKTIIKCSKARKHSHSKCVKVKVKHRKLRSEKVKSNKRGK